MLFAWPALLWLWMRDRRWQAAAIAVITFYLVKQYDNATTTYAFLGSIVFFATFRLRPKWGVWVFAVACVTAVLTMPLMAKNAKTIIELEAPHTRLSTPFEKLRTRFRIWDFVGERILEKPVIGWGMNASRSIPGGSDHLPGTKVNVLPLHPHNAVLQWWLELGFVGAAIAASAFVAVAFGVGRWFEGREAVTGGLSLLILVCVIGLMSYGAWQSWWLATQATCAAMFVAVVSAPIEGGEDNRVSDAVTGGGDR